MISKLQKFFRTDKWWGKLIFILLVYLFFWFLFYGVWLGVTSTFSGYEYDVYGSFLSIGFFYSI